ncbi:MAG: copper chaperone PCu(A)C [Alphaproteobacteria bacterium]
MLTPERRILMAILLLLLPAACAQAGELQVVGGWVTEPIGNVQNSAAYFTVENKTGEADRLTAASTSVAARAELHTHITEDGVMQMRKLSHVEIPAGQNVRFKPGGLHVMLLDLKQPLKAGERVPLTLTFEKAGEVTVELPVRQR